MKTISRDKMREVMCLAWQMVKNNGYGLSQALKTAWRNIKLKARMQAGVVKFYFLKIDGTLREAYGTLRAELLPPAKESDRKRNDTVQVYYDFEKSAYRCFKKANLINVITA